MKEKPILLDIETQRDFFAPGGACYTRDASDAAANIYKLFDWARSKRIPVISTVLRIRKGELGPLAKVPHCIEGTDGEQKLSGTILANRVNLGLRNTTDLPANIFHEHQQVIFEKRDTDIFAHHRAERLLTELKGGIFIVCGAGVANGIVQAAIGLRTRGFGVVLASDAIFDLGDSKAEMSRLRMDAKGVIVAKTKEIISPRLARKILPAYRRSEPANTK